MKRKVGEFFNFTFKNYKKSWEPIENVVREVYILKLENKK